MIGAYRDSIPNIVTGVRILIGIGALYAAATGAQLAALGLFVTAILGDGVDGYLARRLNATSTLGRLLDASADAGLIIGMVTVLAASGTTPQYTLLFLVPFLFDLGFIGLLAYRHGTANIDAHYFDETPIARKVQGAGLYSFILLGLIDYRILPLSLVIGGLILGCTSVLVARMVQQLQY